MSVKRFKGTGPKVKVTKIQSTAFQVKQCAVIDVERSGNWMPAEELKESAMSVLAANEDMTINLNSIDYLDASAMQILLALDAKQKSRGHHLQLVNASPKLRQWFDLSGSAGCFFADQRNADE